MRTKAIGAALLIAAGIGVGLSTARVQADSASPSVRAAARLKYNPPRDWIRHYLADDRYKLKGGTWKVVSTETDTFYYPAWAPEMLRQPAGIVIGFPSAAAAEEAGYKRSKYPMESPLLGLTGRPAPTPVAPPAGPPAAAGGSPIGGFSIPTGQANLNRGKARRIVLSDGVSSAILPPGWSYLPQTNTYRGANGPQEQKMDFFFPGRPDTNVLRNPRNLRFIVLGSMTLPGINAEQIFNARTMRRMAQTAESSGRINTSASGMGSARAASFGNISGISLPIPIPEFGRTVPVYLGGRGPKLFFMIDTSRAAKGGSGIITSFRGR